MTLARASDDPALKQYYEELALKFAENAAKFAENAASQHDPDNIPSHVSPTQATAATPIGTDANKP